MFPSNALSSYFETSDGERLFYVFAPSSFKNRNLPLLVFHYGLVCNFAHWQHQIPFLAQQGYPVLCYHYRGHYTSSCKNLDQCSFFQFAQDLEELLNFLKISKIILLGHSMGVNVSLEYTRLFPKKVLAQILISGTILPPDYLMFQSTLMHSFYPIFKKCAFDYPTFFKTIWKTNFKNPVFSFLIHRLGFNAKEVPLEAIERYLKRMGELPFALFFKLFDQMLHHTIAQDLPNIECPTLILSGDKDNVVPAHTQYLLAHLIPNTKVILIPKGGHVPQEDFPEVINNHLLEFLAEISQRE